MWPYFLLFTLVAVMALVNYREVRTVQGVWRSPLAWCAALLGLTLVVGLRHEVGADWDTYLRHLEMSEGAFWEVVLSQKDPAYGALNWLAAQTFGGVYLVNTICALLFCWGLIAFCRQQPRPWLALMVAIPYLVIVVAMGYTRQGVAIGLAMLALVRLRDGRMWAFLGYLLLASTFHKSAIILAPVAILSMTRQWVMSLLWLLATGAVLASLMLQEVLDNLNAVYFEREYDSSGAAVRVAMNALPALIFLIWQRGFDLPANERRFWAWMSFSALFIIVLLKLSPSSTAVDRLALYWIPLQLFVWSRLPGVMSRTPREEMIWVALTVAYSAVVLTVWLLFASHAHSWLPYQFLP